LGTSGPPRCFAASLPQEESALRADRRVQRTPFLDHVIASDEDLVRGSSQARASQV